MVNGFHILIVIVCSEDVDKRFLVDKQVGRRDLFERIQSQAVRRRVFLCFEASEDERTFGQIERKRFELDSHFGFYQAPERDRIQGGVRG